MRIFKKLYNKLIYWASHPKAPRYLAIVSFFEASCFPLPPDFMLAPMALSKPEKAWRYAWITVIGSVVGGLFGYAIGFFIFEPVVKPLVTHLGYATLFDQGVYWLNKYGIGVILLSGFTPVPYKIFTIASGLVHFPLLPFVVASFIGRSARFYLLAGLVKFGGAKINTYLVKYLDLVGWTIIIGIMVFLIYYYY